MQLDALLTRADDQTLQQLLGDDVLRLLHALNPATLSPATIRSLILQLCPPADLLRDPFRRALLFDLLPLSTAQGLAAQLDLPESDNLYAALCKVSFHRNSQREQRLFDFFATAIPEIQVDIAQPD